MPIISFGIGLGNVSVIHSLGSKDLYESRIALLQEYDLHWAYLSAFMFALLVFFQNIYPL